VKRILTAVVLLPLFIIAVLAPDPAYFSILAALGVAVAAFEFQALAAPSGGLAFNLLASVLSIAVFASCLWPGVLGLSEAILAALFLLLFLCPLLRMEMRDVVVSAVSVFFAAFYLGFMVSYLPALRAVKDLGPQLVFLLAIAVWTGDSAAYYIGSRWGKHKLAPRVSPKKSWEGAIANAAGSILAMAVSKMAFFPSLRPGDVVVLGLLVSVVGQFGDAFESLIKRGAGAKDSSSLLPGHGGMLDRIDSLVFTAPVVFYYHQVFMR
jgi:phosphatidate cytidylyltransferase